MKWSVNDIVEFLNVYQQYPLLWNIKDKDYCNTKLKGEIFQRLYNELNEKQLIGGMDLKQLKAKIKSIKDVYRQELRKIEKSKRSGCGIEGVYSPKLAWFNEANYLSEVLATRSSELNLDLSKNSRETDPELGSECCWESIESTNDNTCPEEPFKNKPPPKVRPPVPLLKRVKKQTVSKKNPSEISTAIYQLSRIAQDAAEEKPYEQFGKFVAAELRQLPQRRAILLQQEIQNCIIRSKLSSIEDVVYSNPQQVVDVAFSPSSDHSLASRSASSNDDDDDVMTNNRL